MTRHVALSSAVMVIAMAIPSRAAAGDTREFQLWTGLFTTVAVPPGTADGLAIWTDLQVRRGPSGTTVIARPALGYRVDPSLSLWGGYAYIGQLAENDDPDVHEHRSWQQLLFAPRWGPVGFQLRPRLEQRIRRDEDVAWRARLFGRMNVKLWHDAPLALAAWDEVFLALHDTSWGAPGGYDQNRLFLGPAYGVGPLRVELGYLSVVVRRADRSLQIQHNVGAMTFVSF
jgi:hypothetical protein